MKVTVPKESLYWRRYILFLSKVQMTAKVQHSICCSSLLCKHVFLNCWVFAHIHIKYSLMGICFTSHCILAAHEEEYASSLRESLDHVRLSDG